LSIEKKLNGRIAPFQARLERTGIARQIEDACTAIRTQLRLRPQTQRKAADTPAAARKQWVKKWIGQPIGQWDERGKQKVLQDWTARWEEDCRRTERIVRPGTDPGGRQTVPEDTPPNRAVLKLHSGLRKAESSVLVQARTGRIGLAKFLHKRKVPGVLSAQCRCGAGEETPRHMALFCTEEAGRRQGLRTDGSINCQQLIGTNGGAKKLAEWMICSGRLGQFSLAKRLLYS
jgi:hypothetical protein